MLLLVFLIFEYDNALGEILDENARGEKKRKKSYQTNVSHGNKEW